MKNVELTNKETRLLIAGLELRNKQNEIVTSDLSKRHTEIFKSCKEELILINKLKDRLESDKETTHNKSDINTLKIKVELDTSDIDKNLKALGERLISIYG